MIEKNILGITDLDTPIYRIFSLHRFMDLLASRMNGLVNPSKWEDPFENFFLLSEIVAPRGERGERISMSKLAEDWYGQCWTFNADTDAMWRIYSRDKDGVRLRTTVRKLFHSFYDSADQLASLKFFCGRVSYYTEDQISALMRKLTFRDVALGGQGDKFAELLCIKREAFQHENEVRLLFQDTIPKRGTGGVVCFPLDVNAVCDDVVVDPRLTDSEALAVERKIRTAGCVLPITKSPLYRAPSFTIRLA